MKKLGLLVMPLMAISLLASCGGGGSTPTEDVKFSVQESSVTLSDNKATIHLDWTPSSNIIEFSNFTFTLKDQPGITTTVAPVEASSRPLELTITFKDALNKNDTGDLKFHFNDKTAKKEGEQKIEKIGIKLPTPGESWTLMLDNDSKNFGDLSYGGTGHEQKGDSIIVDSFIGESSATIDFVPEDRYTGAVFTINANDKKESTFTVEYVPPEEFEGNATITISSDKPFENGDEVVLFFEPKTWTAKLDDASKNFGGLFYDQKKAESIVVIEYIGSESATLSFVPNIDYRATQFNVTASDTRGSTFDVSYAPGEVASVIITNTSGKIFEDGDEVTLHFELPKSVHLIKFIGINCVMVDEDGYEITEDGAEIEEGEVYFRFRVETESNKKYLLPMLNQVSVTYTSGNGEFTDWTYRSSGGYIKINVTADLTVTATADEDPGIPIEENKATFYFKLNSESKEMKNYESIFFTGDILDWPDGSDALEFTRLENTDYYYLSIVAAPIIPDTYGYQLVKGYNATSGKPKTEQGIIWNDSYKSIECRKVYPNNPLFDYAGDDQKISLDVHTFDINLVDPQAEPLTNCTLSITFDESPVFPADDYTVLIFGSMNGWNTPNDGQTPEVRKEIYNNAKMIRDGESLTFTFTYDQLSLGTYEFQICTELNTIIDSGEMMSWHKIEETDPDNAQFSIDESKAGQSGITIEILGEGNKAHFVESQNA